MNSENRTWESLKTEYLHQVEKALSLVNHPRTKDVLEDVISHLDRRFAELQSDEHTWENFQSIITDMGPPCEYAELLDTGQPLKKQRPSLKFVVLGAVVLGIVAAAILILPKLYQPDWQVVKPTEPNIIVPGVRVGDYKLGISKDYVLESLGKPRVIFHGKEKYTLDNLPRRYFMVFDDLSFGIVDDSVQGITALSPRYKFANGLGVGDSEQKVKETFGNDFDLKEFNFKNILTYKKEGLSFEIRNDNKTVMEINVSQKIAHEPSSSKIQQPEPDAFRIRRRVDTLPHPFVNDARVLGNWESVDFVKFVGDFEPGTKQKQGELFLRNIRFMKNGRTSLGHTWTKGWIWRRNGTMKAQYEIKMIGGEHYLFLPWFSGSVGKQGHNPLYYVLKKVLPANTSSPDTQDSVKKKAISTTINAKVAQLDIDTATLDDVIQIFGEPEKYLWGNNTFTKDNLPVERYWVWYPDSIHISMNWNQAEMLEIVDSTYVFDGKIPMGSSLERVISVLGQPKETVLGRRGGEDGVLYKDVNGRKGYCYYKPAGHNVRFIFGNYKVATIYITRSKSSSPARPSQPVRPTKAAVGSFQTIRPIETVKEFDDVRWKDMSKLDLSTRRRLIATLTFNQKTVWPEQGKMPPGSDPNKILTDALNPGLGVRKLHQQGITGKGVNVAIIDQPLYMDHPEYAGKIVAYHDTGCGGSKSSMHGPLVTSLLVGSNCGTAPDARVYYVAAPSWTKDTAYQAKALDWIIEQNQDLPASEKIRVVSVSAAPSGPGSPFEKNQGMWDQACARAEAAGILVLDCTSHRGFIGKCWYDARYPENVTKCNPGSPPNRAFRGDPTDIFVPSSPRTAAEQYDKGEFGYQYAERGGLSRAIPYCAGVLAMGWQVRPDIGPEQMRELLFKSAYTNKNGAKIIYPRKFIGLVSRARFTRKAPRTNRPNKVEREKLLTRGRELKLLKELADAAVQIGGESEVSKLLAALEDEKYTHTRSGIILLVEEIGNKEPIFFLSEQLKSKDRERRCNAGVALELLGDRRGVPAIVKELNDTSYRPTERIKSDGREDEEGQIRQDHYYAALVLGILGDKRAVPALIDATRDETIDYRVAMSLGQIGDERAIPSLHDMLERRSNKPFPRLFAGYGLAMLGDKEGLKVVIDTLNNHQEHWTIRRHAIEALGKLGAKEAVPYLIAALKDEHPNIRVSSAEALGEIGDVSALPALKQALEDKTETKVNAPTSVSEAAAEAIKAIQASATQPARQLFAAHSAKAENSDTAPIWTCSQLLDSQTKSALAEQERFFVSLFQLPIEYERASEQERNQVVNFWISRLRGYNYRKIAEVAAYLSIVKANKAAKPLEKLITARKGGGRLRWVCTRSLGQIGDNGSIPILIDLLDNQNKETRVYARVSLAEITGVYFGEDKEKWRKWQQNNQQSNRQPLEGKMSEAKEPLTSQVPPEVVSEETRSIWAHYRMGTVARHKGIAEDATKAYELIIEKSKGQEAENMHKVISNIYLAEVASELKKDNQLAIKRLQDALATVNSLDMAKVRKDEAGFYVILKGWTSYQLAKLKEEKHSVSKESINNTELEGLFMVVMMVTQMSLNGTGSTIEQLAQNNMSQIDAEIAQLALAFSYMHDGTDAPRAEEYLLSLADRDSYFALYVNIMLELLRDEMKKDRERIPELLNELRHGDREKRSWAASKLAWQSGVDGVKVLYQAQQDPNKYVRYEAACALAQWCRDKSIKPDLNLILEALADEDEQIREKARSALTIGSNIEIGAKEITALVRLMNDHYSQELWWTIKRLLSSLGQDSTRAVVPELIRLLKHKEPDVRNAVLGILRQIGPVASEAIPSLIELLPYDDKTRSGYIFAIIGGMGATAEPFMQEIAEYLDHEDINVRRAANDALRRISPEKTEQIFKDKEREKAIAEQKMIKLGFPI